MFTPAVFHDTVMSADGGRASYLLVHRLEGRTGNGRKDALAGTPWAAQRDQAAKQEARGGVLRGLVTASGDACMSKVLVLSHCVRKACII